MTEATSKNRTQSSDSVSSARIIAALLTLLPAVMIIGFAVFATPDLESWLANQTKGIARRDAFSDVNGISTNFATSFGITSLFVSYLLVAHKSQFLIPLALLTLGIWISFLVTAVWVAIDNTRRFIEWQREIQTDET